MKFKITIVFFILSMLCLSNYYKLKNISKIKTTYHVPNIKSKTMSGNNFVLNKIKSKYILLIFFNDYCLNCLSEIKRIDNFCKEISRDKLFVVGIISPLNEKDLNKLKDKINLPLILDNKYNIFKNYNLKKWQSAKILIRNDLSIFFTDSIHKDEYYQISFQKILTNIINLY